MKKTKITGVPESDLKLAKAFLGYYLGTVIRDQIIKTVNSGEKSPDKVVESMNLRIMKEVRDEAQIKFDEVMKIVDDATANKDGKTTENTKTEG